MNLDATVGQVERPVFTTDAENGRLESAGIQEWSCLSEICLHGMKIQALRQPGMANWSVRVTAIRCWRCSNGLPAERKKRLREGARGRGPRRGPRREHFLSGGVEDQ